MQTRSQPLLPWIAWPCLEEAAHKGQIKGEAKAIRVPRGKNDKIPPQAFSFHMEVRHVLVEPGLRIAGEAAWRSCRQLQVVQLPATAVRLHGAFRYCRALRVVVVPGCQHLNLGKKGQGSTNLNRSLPDCCFLEAGIVALHLPSDFNRIGTAACVSCQQLRTVDLNLCTLLTATATQPFPKFTHHRARSLSQVHLAARSLHPTIPALHCSACFCRRYAASSIL